VKCACGHFRQWLWTVRRRSFLEPCFFRGIRTNVERALAAAVSSRSIPPMDLAQSHLVQSGAAGGRAFPVHAMLLRQSQDRLSRRVPSQLDLRRIQNRNRPSVSTTLAPDALAIMEQDIRQFVACRVQSWNPSVGVEQEKRVVLRPRRIFTSPGNSGELH